VNQRHWKIIGWCVAAVCAVMALVPLFASRDVPLVDTPNHLGAVAIWNHIGDAKYGFSKYYRLHLGLMPYSGYYGALHVMSWIMPLRTANKIFLGALILGLPAGMATWLRAHRRPMLLALAGFPLAWSYLIAWGFTAYCAGSALFVYSLSLLARLADARPWPSSRLFWGNIAIGFGLYLLHPLVWMLWVMMVIVYSRAYAVKLIVPSAALFGWELMHIPKVGLYGGQHAETLSGQWWGVGHSLRDYRRYLFDFLGDDGRAWMLWALVASFALAVVLIRRFGEARPDRRPLLVVVLLFVSYLLLPRALSSPLNWSLINTRMPVLITLTAFAIAGAGSLANWRGILVAAPLVAASVIYPISIAQRFASFDRRAADFYAVADHLPYDPSVLTLIYEGDDPATEIHGSGWVYRHWSSMVQVERGGWNPHAWDLGFPAMQKDGVAKPAPSDGAHDFNWSKHAAGYDWFLTRGEPPNVFSKRPELELIAEQGAWKLWHRK
jgi:hypothetical protein